MCETKDECAGQATLSKQEKKPANRRTKESGSKYSKVKTGCLTCKIRRVKCGEEKPACRRCTSTGRRCDGYVPARVVQLSVDVPGDHEERRGYHFFRLKSIGEILGRQDADFWKSLFLQVSHSEPTVRHALIAVASIHESVELAESGNTGNNNELARKRRAYSLAHYNKAIRRLIEHNPNSGDHVAMALILCILFVVLEEFQSGYAACALHLQGGLALLRQWSSSKTVTTKPEAKLGWHDDMINQHITPVLNRLLVVASTFADSQDHTAMSPAYTFRPFVLDIPPTFSSLREARQALEEFMRWMFYSVSSPEASSVAEIRARLQQQLEEWLRAANHLLVCAETRPDPGELSAARSMRIYYYVSFIIIDTYLSNDEMMYDRHIMEFTAIVGLSEEILSMVPAAEDEHAISFSFDFGVTPPLYFTASHCRDPLIRRRALELLRRSHRKQGSWNSEHTAKCAEMIIRIEEAGLGLVETSTQVPKERRIRKVYADVQYEKGCIKVGYVHAPYDLKTPLRIVYIPLRTDAIRCHGNEQRATGTTGNVRARNRLEYTTSVTAFISKTYFPQETI